MEKIEDEHYFYSLWVDRSTDEHFLDVLCGTVAQFTITIRLTSYELLDYKKDSSTVQTLADNIACSPQSFMSRNIQDFDPYK